MQLVKPSLALVLALAACSQPSNQSTSATEGPNPPLAKPRSTTFPTVNVAKAILQGKQASKPLAPLPGAAD